MKKQHTPGPWQQYSEQRDQLICTPNGKEIATVSCRVGAQYRANARLIAAAPDLLAALREAEATLAWMFTKYGDAASFDRNVSVTLPAVRAALAKVQP